MTSQISSMLSWGLSRWGAQTKPAEYITNITSIQQTVIHSIMKNIDDPSVAALLIGKYSQSSRA